VRIGDQDVSGAGPQNGGVQHQVVPRTGVDGQRTPGQGHAGIDRFDALVDGAALSLPLEDRRTPEPHEAVQLVGGRNTHRELLGVGTAAGWVTKVVIRDHISGALEYIGKCAQCGISASSTPLAARWGREDRVLFCSPYMNMVGSGNARNRSIRPPLSESSTMELKIGPTAPARTFCDRPAAYRELP